MKVRSSLYILLILAAAMAACTPATPPVTAEPPLIDTGSPGSQIELGGLPPGTILVQQDYLPGFTRTENHFVFGRVAPFTLYGDGTVIYLEEGSSEAEQRLMQASLNPEEILELIGSVMAAGFEGLESYTDMCISEGADIQTCVADASTTILRVRMPSGELREVKNYFEFANDPEALKEIRRLLDEFNHPDARSFEPSGATLFISPFDQADGLTITDWPLDPAWLAALDIAPGTTSAVPLQGDILASYMSAVSRNIGDSYFEADGQIYGAYLVPWLPGADFSEDIRLEFAGVPEPSPRSRSRFQGCWILEPSLMGTLRLAWIEAGDLWLWDRGAGEPYSLTSSGDVTAVRLTPSGRTVVFVRQTGSGAELWAADADGLNLRLLTGDQDLLGDLEMHSFSYDESKLAFTLLLPENGGELWAADLDGSGAKRLVSHEDLMAIVNEPLADFATPTGVSWLPNTYVLTYDAFPGFEEEGIYIYVQRQVYVVDTLSGAKDATLPLGEGGQVAYSPDGTMMTIATPDSLRLMNIEARDLHEAGFDFFAPGFGEFYAFPPMAWTADSQSLLVAQPSEDGYSQDGVVTIWSVPADGSEPNRLAEFSGFFPSFTFSPDLTKVAYWRESEPQSNTRELHIAALDGSEHVVYDTDHLLDFLGWAPDSQGFVYSTGEWPGKVRLANVCGEPVPLSLDFAFYPVNINWIHYTRFLFERRDEGAFEVYLGIAESPEQSEMLLNLEESAGYDAVVLPAGS